MNKQVDLYLVQGCGRCPLVGTPQCKVNPWREVLIELRDIILKSGLKEELKWSMPCYTFQGKNVLVLAAFKNYASISFFKGALIKDNDGLLSKPGEHTMANRLLKFNHLNEVLKLKKIIKQYIAEAIEIEKKGLKIVSDTSNQPSIPPELESKFKELPPFKKAFYALTPGRQRAYLLYFTSAKQSATRVSRIEKYISAILNGIGFND